MGKFIAFLLLFGMFIFIYHGLSGGEGAADEQGPKVVTIKRDRQLETGIDHSRTVRHEADDWGPAN